MKLQEAMATRAELLHRKTILEEVNNFLSQFVEDEVHKPDRTMITGDLGSVPQKLIRGVMEGVQKDIDQLGRQVSEIEGMKVEDTRGKAEKGAATEASPQGAAAKGSGKARSIKITKQVGRGSSGHRAKVSGAGADDESALEEPAGAGKK